MIPEKIIPDARVIVALDYASIAEADRFADSVTPDLCKLKVGKELFTLAGPDFVRRLVNRGFDVFLDLKFHDIPNTVAQAVAVAADLGVWMTDLHASGGRRMMEAARAQLEQYSSYLVIGRPITQSENPLQALQAINQQIQTD